MRGGGNLECVNKLARLKIPLRTKGQNCFYPFNVPIFFLFHFDIFLIKFCFFFFLAIYRNFEDKTKQKKQKTTTTFYTFNSELTE